MKIKFDCPYCKNDDTLSVAVIKDIDSISEQGKFFISIDREDLKADGMKIYEIIEQIEMFMQTEMTVYYCNHCGNLFIL